MYLKQLKDFLEHPLSEVEYIQDFYNILEKKAENLIFPFKTAKQKFMAYGPLYRGIMTSLTMKELLEKDEDAVNRLIKNRSLPLIYKQKQLYQMIAQKK
jgi:aryl-alcohol dehydrogenase-like predicted oxidoreductase